MPPHEAVLTELRRRRDLQARRIQERGTEATRGRCKTLAGFIREAWSIVEPETPLIWNWHLDALCEHLEAVTYGRINRLLINVPPGTSKSLVVSVLWPAWEWGPAGLAHLRYLATSYNDTPINRDTRKCRDLMLSDWYAELWPHVVLTRKGETSFTNTRTGHREGLAFSSLTSQRGDRLIIDDPHSTETAESDTERKATTRRFREGATNRLNDQQRSAIVIVMQRLHVDDISGLILRLGMPFEHLMLPMEFEPDRRCRTSIGFVDPRKEDGDLLDPERFPSEVVAQLKADMGSYAYAGQYQQRPTLREGGLFKRGKIRLVDRLPQGVRWIRGWDLAATEEQASATSDPAYTAGGLLGLQPDGGLIIGDMKRERFDGNAVRELILDTAEEDDARFGPIEISLPQDPGQAGKEQAQSYVRLLSGHNVYVRRESGSKVQRAEPLAAQVDAGNVEMLRGAWNDALLDELADFPAGKFKDQVDALTGAYGRLIGRTVFDFPEDLVAEEPLERIPSTWPRMAAIEINNTGVGVIWGAIDRAGGEVLHLWAEYARPRTAMAIHAEAIRERGGWIPILMEPKAKGRSEEQGEQMAESLAGLGVDVMTTEMNAEAAAELVANMLATGKLRVASTLRGWFAEYRRYSRDDRGRLPSEEPDHLMRATMLIAAASMDIGITENRAASDAEGYEPRNNVGERPSTGY